MLACYSLPATFRTPNDTSLRSLKLDWRSFAGSRAIKLVLRNHQIPQYLVFWLQFFFEWSYGAIFQVPYIYACLLRCCQCCWKQWQILCRQSTGLRCWYFGRFPNKKTSSRGILDRCSTRSRFSNWNPNPSTTWSEGTWTDREWQATCNSCWSGDSPRSNTRGSWVWLGRLCFGGCRRSEWWRSWSYVLQVFRLIFISKYSCYKWYLIHPWNTQGCEGISRQKLMVNLNALPSLWSFGELLKDVTGIKYIFASW